MEKKHYAITDEDGCLHGVILAGYENEFIEKLNEMLDASRDPIQKVEINNYDLLSDYDSHHIKLIFWNGDEELEENFEVKRITVF